MSDDDTHRVVRKAHRRSNDGPGGADVYEPGDTLTPTDAELDAFGARFEALDSEGDEAAEDAPSDADDDETTEDTTDDSEDATDATGDETASPDSPPDPLTVEWVEDADYDELRGVASRYDDVNGNWGTDRLRAELREQAADAE